MDHNVPDEQLDALLRKRAVPEMRSNLAYRIIEASHHVPQEKPGLAGLRDKTREAGIIFLKGVASVLDHVVLPQPAFAAAMVVFLMGGVFLGAQTGDLNVTTFLSDIGYASSYDSSDVETFIMATDSFEYGDFL